MNLASMFSAEALARQGAALDEMARDKQDDDWSHWAGFSIESVPFLGTKYRWMVLANGYEAVGTYDTLEQASLVKAKLEYRLAGDRHHGLIGMDGVPGPTPAGVR